MEKLLEGKQHLIAVSPGVKGNVLLSTGPRSGEGPGPVPGARFFSGAGWLCRAANAVEWVC